MAHSSQAKWLDVQVECAVPLKTVLPNCMTLCDLKNDGYYKLIITEIPQNCEEKPKLKIYKGVNLMTERGLPDLACGVTVLYIDEPEPKIPVIAVGIGPSVLLYRNLKPYFKFTLPPLDVEPLERDIWEKLPGSSTDEIEEFIKNLKGLDPRNLTTHSKTLLSLSDSDRADFIKQNAGVKLERLSVVTCFTSMNKNSNDKKACLVVASEDGDLYILDSHAFTILHHARVCSYKLTPVFISVSGQFDVDFNIVLSTREDEICIIKKGWLEGQSIVRLEHPITGITLLPVDQTIIAVSTDKCLICFSKRGKRIWFTSLPEKVICMTPITLSHLGITLICVGLAGKVQLYLQKKMVDEFEVESPVSMIFGRLGQEEHVLVLVTESGKLLIKILKRTATFTTDSAYDESLVKNRSMEDRLIIPKKSKIFLEQMQREKENAVIIHNTFQAELWRMRLTAAKETIDMINASESTFSTDAKQVPLKLSTEILDSGPGNFKMYIQLENLSKKKEGSGLSILLHANHKHFGLNKCYMELPMLVPTFPIKMDFDVTVKMDPTDGLPPSDLTPDSSIIRVLIIKEGQTRPLIASTITIPVIPFQ